MTTGIDLPRAASQVMHTARAQRAAAPKVPPPSASAASAASAPPASRACFHRPPEIEEQFRERASPSTPFSYGSRGSRSPVGGGRPPRSSQDIKGNEKVTRAANNCELRGRPVVIRDAAVRLRVGDGRAHTTSSGTRVHPTMSPASHGQHRHPAREREVKCAHPGAIAAGMPMESTHATILFNVL